MRPMTLEGQAPLLYSRMAVAISVDLRPAMRGMTESGIFVAAWQPVHELAPGGASAARAGPPSARLASNSALASAGSST